MAAMPMVFGSTLILLISLFFLYSFSGLHVTYTG